MKITILGAGAMGSLFGGLLAQADQSVTLLDINDAHLEAVRAQGLHLQTDKGEQWIRHIAVNRPELENESSNAFPDLLIVFTKTIHTRNALSSVQRLIGPKTYVLSLQNGLGNVEKINEYVPLDRILIGVTTWPADMVGPGRVCSHGQGVVRMMSADGQARTIVEEVVGIFQKAGLNGQMDTHVWAAVWEKVAFNAALNTLCTVVGCTVDHLRTPEGFSLALAIAREVLNVAHAKGIKPNTAQVEETVAHAIGHHYGHKPSMLQDVLAGRHTEIESINGEVIRLAQELNIPVPNTRCLYGLVRLVEDRVAKIK